MWAASLRPRSARLAVASLVRCAQLLRIGSKPALLPERILQRSFLLFRVLWALPCSAVGSLLGLLLICLGGTLRRADHTLEFALAPGQGQVPRWAARCRFAAITFGHVIVGQSHEVLAALRPHERVHVRQYERLGLLFFLAYPASSLMAWLQGECPYLGNRFEQEAISLASIGENRA